MSWGLAWISLTTPPSTAGGLHHATGLHCFRNGMYPCPSCTILYPGYSILPIHRQPVHTSHACMSHADSIAMSEVVARIRLRFAPTDAS
ncbi:unnamed protein product [Chondrus crispus]|uniref:C2H2-type domain-containing protein n=1 Tax=Chondrus crispus TaxID=2769 RepID=R7QMZ1_CHOCR|nr:unnamed protein product [Chondrus crispus]CDF38851.1 unnamed protein product [Chondrus crispus]|eukprot:XP_005718756.1 unnamed protein product [Chondrus crispus]